MSTLWMPEGSVRAIRMLILTAALVYLVVTEKTVPGWFQVVAVGDLAGYSLTRVFASQGTRPPVNLDDVDLLRKVRQVG